MKNRNRRFAACIVLALALALPALSAPTPEAQKLLDRMAELVDRGPFAVNYDAKMSMPVMGAPAKVEMGGSLTQTDRQHMRMTMEMTMTPEGSTQGGLTMNGKMISDGTTLWTEMTSGVARAAKNP